MLIEKGILRGYLQDRLNARLMKMEPTGNGRRESFAHSPMPRMTNTFMLPGESTAEEILGSVRKGLYAVSFGGGQVDITNGKFVFSASEAYLIEDGKVTRPVKVDEVRSICGAASVTCTVCDVSPTFIGMLRDCWAPTARVTVETAVLKPVAVTLTS